MTARLYLDAPPVIYAVEHREPYAERVRIRLREPGIILVASDLTRLECRIQPMRRGNTELLADFDRFFRTVVDEIVGLTTGVLDLATGIRAVYGFPTPDSIHLAAALWARCDAFFTNDHRLDRFDRIRIEVVER